MTCTLKPPKKTVPDDPPDMPISLRMKYGSHTIFILIKPLATFSDLDTELIFALRDSNISSLCASTNDPEPTPLPPPDKDTHIAYGLLKDPHDETKGWKDIKAQGDDTLVSKGLKNNTVVAFVIRETDETDETDETPDFVVQWPQYDDDGEDEDEEMQEEDNGEDF